MTYHFQKNSKITSLIKLLNQHSYFIKLFPLSASKSLNLRRQSTLKSSLFSARIEGNSLEPYQLESESLINSKNKQKVEVQNLQSAHNYIFSSRSPRIISLQLVKTLHQYCLRSLSPLAGKLRKEQTAIFNQAGVAVYLTPPPQQIKPMLLKHFDFSINRNKNIYTTAAVSHFWFEKIHPFVDGNGRVGRLLTQFQLDNHGQNFSGLLSFEEQLDHFRSEYYSLLSINTKDITNFVEFYLEILEMAAKQAVDNIKTSPPENLPEDSLLPRRKEILLLVRDHQLLSFDQIHRRFLAIKPSTLHYDLRQLIKSKLIKKLGSTRGALYAPDSG